MGRRIERKRFALQDVELDRNTICSFNICWPGEGGHIAAKVAFVQIEHCCIKTAFGIVVAAKKFA